MQLYETDRLMSNIHNMHMHRLTWKYQAQPVDETTYSNTDRTKRALYVM